jgi:hypothetical protein
MSDELTPRMSQIESRLDQLFVLLRSMNERMERMEDRLVVIEDRLKPTNKLDLIYAQVKDISQKLDSLSSDYEM